MALVNFKRGLESSITSIKANNSAADGTFYLSTDSGYLYVGQSDGSLLKINDTPLATSSINGLMSASDKSKLDGVPIVVTPQQFGAVADGTTDDTTAIQNALDSLTSGGKIYFPSGTYLISSALTFSVDGITLEGEDEDSTIIYQTSTSDNHIDVTDVSYINISKLTFTGMGINSAGGGGLSFNRSNQSNVGYLHISDVTIKQIASNGIYVNTAILSNFERINVRQVAGHGFYLVNGSTSCVFTACYAITCVKAGFNFSGLNYSVISGCAAEVCGIGYYLHKSCNTVALIGCGAEDNLYRSSDYPQIDYYIHGGTANSLISCYSRLKDPDDTSNITAVGIRNSGCSGLLVDGYRQLGTGQYAIVDSVIEGGESHNPDAEYRQIYTDYENAPSLIPAISTGKYSSDDQVDPVYENTESLTWGDL